MSEDSSPVALVQECLLRMRRYDITGLDPEEMKGRGNANVVLIKGDHAYIRTSGVMAAINSSQTRERLTRNQVCKILTQDLGWQAAFIKDPGTGKTIRVYKKLKTSL